jgi:cardiolipin synthase
LILVLLITLIFPGERAFPADPFLPVSGLKLLQSLTLQNDCAGFLLHEGAEQLISLLVREGSDLTRAELIGLLQDLERKGTLDASIAALARLAVREAPEERAREIAHLMRAELRSEAWISQDAADAMLRKKLLALSPGTGLNSRDFWKFLRDQAGARRIRMNAIELLPRNSDSLQARLRLIEGARHSIDILSWGWVDDSSGEFLARALIQKKQERPSLRIRILVDGAVASQAKYNDTLKVMAQNGIEVVNARVSSEPFHGMHQKMMIRDAGATAPGATPELILGGRNPGDDYFLDQGWSDFDLRIRGPFIQEAAIRFRALWNRSAPTALAEDATSVLGREFLAETGPALGANSIGLLSHHPDRPGEDPVLLAALAILKAAKRQVWISNAYFLPPPVLIDSIGAAVRRGVEVRVLTNSPLSIDEWILGFPMLDQAKKLSALGVKVFLKQGKTLHEKVLVADGEIALAGSYNFHPRSQWYEMESAVVFSDEPPVNTPAPSRTLTLFQSELSARFDAAIPLQAYLAGRPERSPTPQEVLSLKIFEWFRRQF